MKSKFKVIMDWIYSYEHTEHKWNHNKPNIQRTLQQNSSNLLFIRSGTAQIISQLNSAITTRSIAMMFKAVLFPYLLLNLSRLDNNLFCWTIAVCWVLLHDPSRLEACPQWVSLWRSWRLCDALLSERLGKKLKVRWLKRPCQIIKLDNLSLNFICKKTE